MTSCLKDECSEVQRFVQFEEKFAHPNDFRVDISTEGPREMIETGKIYFYNDFILINEKYEGIHIIDNSNPEAPNNIAFVNIPGNLDVAIRDNIMYADNYVDLLTIDFNNFNNPSILGRDEDVFKNYHWQDNRGYFIAWIPTNVELEVDCSNPNFGEKIFNNNGNIFVDQATAGGGGFDLDTNGTISETSQGQGGSFARFSLVGNHLYVINASELSAFNIDDLTKPRFTNTTYVNWNIETLFAYNSNLFIGSQNGVFIYSLDDPSTPQYVSEFRHAQACDPVFVKDDIAYVTLRGGTWCQNFTNQLDILDVSDLANPKLIASYDMQNPHGLSVIDNTLYICEGQHGLKVYSTDDLNAVTDNQLDHVKDFDAYDAIALNSDHLLVIGQDGLLQFNTEDKSDIKQISEIRTK